MDTGTTQYGDMDTNNLKIPSEKKDMENFTLTCGYPHM